MGLRTSGLVPKGRDLGFILLGVVLALFVLPFLQGLLSSRKKG